MLQLRALRDLRSSKCIAFPARFRLSLAPRVVVVSPPMLRRGSLIYDTEAAAEKEPVFDKMLLAPVLSCPKLVLGGELGSAPDAETVPDIQPMPVLRNVHGDLSLVPEFVAVKFWAEETLRLTTQP